MKSEGTNSNASIVRVAIADEDPTARRLMRHWLCQRDYHVVQADNLDEAQSLMRFGPDIVCLDLGIGEGSGLDLLRKFRATAPDVPVIVVTTRRDAETAVLAMRAGAFDYVVKPIENGRLMQAVAQARKRRDVLLSVEHFGSELAERTLGGPMGGRSSAIVELDRNVARVVDHDVSVCLLGESGSGKELVAKAIHSRSARRHGPYISLDCGAFEGMEQETALFGEEKRTGATICGAFEEASGGLLFLDQVGCLSLRAQATLSRVLSTRLIRRVGGTEDVSVNVRVVAAHSSDLRQLVDAGHLREDLYFRLAVYPVTMPALRERQDDIPLLVSYFLRQVCKDSEVGVRQFSPEALEALIHYSWPGNIGELEHVVHRSSLSARKEVIVLADLPANLRDLRERKVQSDPESERAVHLAKSMHFPDNEVVPLRDLERKAIEHALRVTGGSVSVAAQKLGIGRATLYRRIASFDLSQNVA